MVERILLVEDEKTISELVAESLKRRGYLVETAFDGDTGLFAVETSLPDLVILDVMLPGMDGWEVCRRIHENPATRRIPVLMLTASGGARPPCGLRRGSRRLHEEPFS